MSDDPSWHDLIPLELAARAVHKRAYGNVGVATSSSEQLNGLAYAMAGLIPIFAVDAEPRQISPDHLLQGFFRGGAKELHFLDGRPAMKRLAVLSEGVDKVVESLLAAKK